MWSFEIFKFDFYFIFYNFFLYCFFGWIYESCLVSLKKKTWVNRGFLNGPVIPIYGAGATIVYICLAPFQDNSVLVFLCGMLIATVLEFITSYVMEKLFHAKWWDYSDQWYNIQGRVCIMASLFWGFLSVLMIDVLQPLMNWLINKISRKAGEVGGIFIFLIFTADLTVTIIYTLQLDQKIVDMGRLRREIAEYLENTRLYETKEEIKNRLEELSIGEFYDYFKGQFDERFNRLEGRMIRKEDFEQKIKGFVSKYQKTGEIKNFVQKRLMKAFPSMKSTRSESIINELRKKRNK